MRGGGEGGRGKGGNTWQPVLIMPVLEPEACWPTNLDYLASSKPGRDPVSKNKNEKQNTEGGWCRWKQYSRLFPGLHLHMLRPYKKVCTKIFREGKKSSDGADFGQHQFQLAPRIPDASLLIY